MSPRDMTAFVVLVAAGLIAVGALALSMRTPRAEADWQAPLIRAPVFHEEASGAYRLENFRDFLFAPGGDHAPQWRSVALDPEHLSEMWYFVEPFPANGAFAHSFISFLFDDGVSPPQAVAISIEARLEEEESYSPIRGVFRNYELLYVWSTERDILSRIAIGLEHDLYAYKIDLEPERQRRLFSYFVQRTNGLAGRPRFYNTLHSNCTNELAKAVNAAFPDSLPWHGSWILTGRSAKWLHDLGWLANPDEKPFDQLTEESNIRRAVHDAARDGAHATDFPAAWRKRAALPIAPAVTE